MPPQPLTEARDALVAGGVTGPHRSHSRRDNIAKIEALVEGDRDVALGLPATDKYSVADVLAFLARLTGCSSDPEQLEGEDTIDPQRTVDAIVAAARRLLEEAWRGSTLLAATGHPTGLLEHHIRVVDAYVGAGGRVMRPREAEKFASAGKQAELRYVAGVGCVAIGASLRHTHSADAMEFVLDNGAAPDVVLGDHGFAGAAIARDVPTVAVMDINDPALAVAWGEQRDVVVIPMDDNRPPRLYEPAWRLFESVLAGDAS